MKSFSDPNTVREIMDRVRRLPLGAPAKWGKMNAHQMMCHLSDSFLGTTGQRTVSKRSGIFQRTVMKYGALYFPMEWPKGIPTMPEVDQLQGGTPPVEWERDKAELLRLMEWFSSPQTNKAEHPIFGRMTEAQWMRWAYLHCDHHLRQFGS
jgi:hypothetical protein